MKCMIKFTRSIVRYILCVGVAVGVPGGVGLSSVGVGGCDSC